MQQISQIRNIFKSRKNSTMIVLSTITIIFLIKEYKRKKRLNSQSNSQISFKDNSQIQQNKKEENVNDPPTEQLPNSEIKKELNNQEEDRNANISTQQSSKLQVASSQKGTSQIELPQKILQKSDFLEKIYNLTCRKRDVQPEFRNFVGDQKDEEFLVEEYGERVEKLEQTLRDNLCGMRRARGDGNCFYTSFGYQFLQFYLLNELDQEFQYLIDLINQQQFQITLKDNQSTEQDSQLMKQLYIEYCNQIRNIKQKDQRKQEYHNLFSDPNGQFYGLSVIFLRNLAYNICNQNEDIKQLFEALGLDLNKELLEWEQDCENNQSIIVQLSIFLRIQINLFYIESEQKKLDIQVYQPEDKPKFNVYLLFRPGHYNIAIPKQKQ